MGGFILTPLLLEQVLGYGETRAGLLSIARPLSFSIAGPLAGYFAVRVGERKAATFGTLAIVCSMIGLSLVSPVSSDLLIVVALALSGIGAGATLPAMAATIANAVDDRDLGVVGAAQQMVAQLGAVTGIQILQTVQASREAVVGETASYHAAYRSGAAVAAVGGVCRLRAQPSAPDAGRPTVRRPVGAARRGLTGRPDAQIGDLLDLVAGSRSGSGRCGACWRSMSLLMSPWTLTLPGHEGLHPGLRRSPSTVMALAVA